jgi:hypothetical protein
MSCDQPTLKFYIHRTKGTEAMSATAERSYTTVDKSGWGNGPWQEEPDKIQWVDPETDLDCLIVRGPVGALCGYVGVPMGHPFYGADYNSVLVEDPEDRGRFESPNVNGGLTYAAKCQEGSDESEGICHVPLAGRSDEVWWLGFDCAHLHDLCPGNRRGEWASYDETYKTVGYVRREIESLARQFLGNCKVERRYWERDGDESEAAEA